MSDHSFVDRINKFLDSLFGDLQKDGSSLEREVENPNEINKRRKHVVDLYNRTRQLYESLRRKGIRSYSDRDAVVLYTTLRQEAEQLFSDPAFDSAVPPAYQKNTTNEILRRLQMLFYYVQQHIADHYPSLRSQVLSKETEDWEMKYRQLGEHYRTLKAELENVQHQQDELRRLYASLQTPAQLTISEEILDKLEPLEQTRLLEAVQAYRVSA